MAKTAVKLIVIGAIVILFVVGWKMLKGKQVAAAAPTA